jgi:hypothetical protein
MKLKTLLKNPVGVVRGKKEARLDGLGFLFGLLDDAVSKM